MKNYILWINFCTSISKPSTRKSVYSVVMFNVKMTNLAANESALICSRHPINRLKTIGANALPIRAQTNVLDRFYIDECVQSNLRINLIAVESAGGIAPAAPPRTEHATLVYH